MSAVDAARWARVAALRLDGRSFDPTTGVATLHYALGEDLRFTETVTFPMPDRVPGSEVPGSEVLAVFERVLDLLHIAASTSYYKVAAPPRVELDTPLPVEALDWAHALYRDGLGEFAYQNDLPHVLDLPVVPVGRAVTPVAPLPPGPAGLVHAGDRPPLVTVGGGKDSIVSVEVLRRGDFGPVLFAVNPNPIIRSVMAVSDAPVLAARRVLDPKLRELNAAGAYNGHIPVTAINSLVAVGTAVLHGLGPVVMSNESSASVPNLTWHGRDINHQWSKGLPAERHLSQALVGHAGRADGYFSLLRGLSEVHIASLFARFTAYDHVVTSCNAAFKLSGASERWCGDCPKCRFVFLALAPFTGRDRLTHIFGANLLADTAQLPGYRELVGLSAHKPFECVGEIDESRVVVRMLSEHPDWASAPVVAALRRDISAGVGTVAGTEISTEVGTEIGTAVTDADVAAVFAGDGEDLVPPRYRAALRALIESPA